MTENMKKYLELISGDEEAMKKLNEQESSSIQEAKERIIADAAERGVTLIEEDFNEAAEVSELSEDELEAVTGGDSCVCVLGGRGTATDAKAEKTCACVIFGAGEGTVYEVLEDTPWISPRKYETYRCTCCFGGTGVRLFEVKKSDIY